VLPADFVAACTAEEEVEIVTTRADGAPRRTVLWVVVEAGLPYLRSYRGPDGRWYRDVVVRPDATLVAGRHAQPVRVVPATDPASIAACSSALARKYAADPSLPAMLDDSVLATTLRVEAR